MNIQNCLTDKYPTVHPEDPVKKCESFLNDKGYAVVVDERQKYFGILSSLDVIGSYDKSVLECLTNKEIIQINDTLNEILLKFNKISTDALAVYDDDNFLGILEKNIAIKILADKLNQLSNEAIFSNEARKSLIRNLAQDVKSPLNKALEQMSCIVSLPNSEVQAGETNHYLSTIRQSSEQLSNAIESMCGLSPVISGEHIPEKKDIATIEPMLCKLIEHFEEAAIKGDYNLKILRQAEDSNLFIYTNYNKLYMLLFNMIETNIKLSNGSKNKCIEIGYELFEYKSKIQFYIKSYNISIDMTKKQYLIAYISGKKDICPTDLIYQNQKIDITKNLTEELEGTMSIEMDDHNNLTTYLSIPYTF